MILSNFFLVSICVSVQDLTHITLLSPQRRREDKEESTRGRQGFGLTAIEGKRRHVGGIANYAITDPQLGHSHSMVAGGLLEMS